MAVIRHQGAQVQYSAHKARHFRDASVFHKVAQILQNKACAHGGNKGPRALLYLFKREVGIYQVAQQHHNARFTCAGAFGIQHADFQRGVCLQRHAAPYTGGVIAAGKA